MLNPHSDSDKDQNLITYIGSFLADAYHVRSTFVNAFVSYPAHGRKDRHTD